MKKCILNRKILIIVISMLIVLLVRHFWRYYSDENNQWKGKTWFCYGTSISNVELEGKYPIYLAELSGLELENRAISGGCMQKEIVSAGPMSRFSTS